MDSSIDGPILSRSSHLQKSVNRQTVSVGPQKPPKPSTKLAKKRVNSFSDIQDQPAEIPIEKLRKKLKNYTTINIQKK